MGLDQHLYVVKTLACGYESVRNSTDEDKKRDVAKFDAVLAAVGFPFGPETKIVEVRVQVGYWRKAWPLHHWMAEHCGVTAYCETMDCSAETIRALREFVATPEPAAQGWDARDIERTAAICDAVLSTSAFDGCLFAYKAAW